MVALFAMLVGCTVTPYKDLNLDTTSGFTYPSTGKAGIYVYQWKTGIMGALYDIDFEIKGHEVTKLNTGEYAYFEIEPGKYEYMLSGGIFKQYLPVEFEEDQNYFFRAFMLSGYSNAYLVFSQSEIDEAKINILSGRYEKHDVD